MRSCLPLLLALLAVLNGAAAQADTSAVPAGAASGLSLRCTPHEAEVFVDGESIGRTPLPRVFPLTAGEHTIRVSRPGFTPFVDVFKAKEGQVAKLDVELVPITGVLRLTAEGDAVRVFIDQRYAGDAPVEAELSVGSHKVRVERAGYAPETFAVNAVAGQLIDKAIKLSALPDEQNPYLRKPPAPPKWYQKWWVWTIAAVGAAGVATAIIVPLALSRRDVCDGLDVCAQNIGVSSTQRGLGSLGVSVAF